MTPYEQLSEPIRRYIRDKRWDALRPIQAAAIVRILSTNNHYVLASRTASGKTEAAFLPVLSTVDFTQPGIRVLYISPLKALLNDQLERIEELCSYLEIPVTKWHGEAKQSDKKKILHSPEGVLLITPESLEAMFVTRSDQIKHLFEHLQFVIVDEIHAFLGTDRGVQLQSLLSRLQSINKDLFRIIALSATIGNYEAAKQFTGEPERTKVLVDKSVRKDEVVFGYYPEQPNGVLSLDLLKELYRKTNGYKSLIFPNSKSRVEEIAISLQKLNHRVGGTTHYFSHHASIDKEEREYVEFFAKHSKYESFAIVCTSTLELGIDIGQVDQVFQVDATQSVSSMVQRLGRSGRREDSSGKLFLYTTTPMSMLQALACWNLYQRQIIDSPVTIQKPYDLLVHQLLSIVKGSNGMPLPSLIKAIQMNFAFVQVLETEIKEIVLRLLTLDILEEIDDQLIIGLAGEKLVNHRDFYSTFPKETNLKVLYKNQIVGDVLLNPSLKEGENILLAGALWTITETNFPVHTIHVEPAKDGKKPLSDGKEIPVQSFIREEMFRILFSDDAFDFLDEGSGKVLEALREEYKWYQPVDIQLERPLIRREKELQLLTFLGTRETEAFSFLLQHAGLKAINRKTYVSIENCVPYHFYTIWGTLLSLENSVDSLLMNLLMDKPDLIRFSKWGEYLPLSYQIQLLKEKRYDFEAAFEFIRSVKWIEKR